METSVMREGSRTPYSRAPGSLNPTGGQKAARQDRSQLAGTSRKSLIFSIYWSSCGCLARSPYPLCASPLGCASKPVRPARAAHPHFPQQRSYAMRTFDLAPLFPSSVGFERLLFMLDGFGAAPSYQAYNIEHTGENAYRMSVAVAGFGENELSIEAKENTLTIKGEKQTKDEK